MRSRTVRSRGRVTIPQDVRIGMGLKKGDRVEFVVEDDEAILLPVRIAEESISASSQSLPAFKNRKEINDSIREMRDEEPEGK
jgi:AbrB family looped-hinge helix DNA binding protein